MLYCYPNSLFLCNVFLIVSLSFSVIWTCDIGIIFDSHSFLQMLAKSLIAFCSKHPSLLCCQEDKSGFMGFFFVRLSWLMQTAWHLLLPWRSCKIVLQSFLKDLFWLHCGFGVATCCFALHLWPAHSDYPVPTVVCLEQTPTAE